MKSKAIWAAVGGFFFAGVALALWDETSWLRIGQVWILATVMIALFHLGLGERILAKVKGPIAGKLRGRS